MHSTSNVTYKTAFCTLNEIYILKCNLIKKRIVHLNLADDSHMLNARISTEKKKIRKQLT